MSHTISSGDVSQLHGELSLYTSGPGLKEFFTALEECQRTERWFSEIACPFPSIPILMSHNVVWNGGVWNIKIDGSSLPEADDRTLDCLRAAAREILHKPKLPQYDLLPAIDASRNSTAAYRTSLVHRWRTSLTQMLLHRWFSAKQYERACQLFLNDAEKIKQQERARTTQLNLAVKTVFSPAAYADGRVVLCPKQKESALEALQTAYALFYVPGTSAKAKGPFLCFSNASLQRLLVNHDIPSSLMEEIISRVKCEKNRTETIPFQKGQQERFIKVDISGCPELLSKLQSLQANYAQ